MRITHAVDPVFAFALQAEAFLVQDASNGGRPNVWQSALVQSLFQQLEGPGRGLVALPIGLPLHFLQHTGSLLCMVGQLPASFRGNHQDGQPSLVEPFHQLGDPLMGEDPHSPQHG
jgi:hypothetical protein